MATNNADQIERQFSELPTQVQLDVLERLVHCVRTRITTTEDDFAAQMAAMAKDPEIVAEIRQIDAEFRITEKDGLNPA